MVQASLVRSLVDRSHHRLALVLWGVLMLLQIPAAYQGNAMALASDAFVFQNGYTVAWDAVYGLVLMGLPIGVYELLTAAPTRGLGRPSVDSH